MDRMSKRSPWVKSVTLPIARSTNYNSKRMPRRSRLLEATATVVVLALVWFLLVAPRKGSIKLESATAERSKPVTNATEALDLLPCSQLRGAKDTVVVLQTSAAELEQRLPIHFETTLRCYPNRLIFSDWNETYQGHPILDAIANIDFKRKQFHPDLDLWRRLRDGGPDVLEDEEMWNAEQTTAKLDKWKYLLMINQTLYEYPEKKWFVFLQTDTFIFWNNLLTMLRAYDSKKAWFLGAQVEGSELADLKAGFVLSHAAMQALMKMFRADYESWQQRADYHPSGASILGTALAEAGVQLSNAWPLLQSSSLGSLDWSESRHERKLWCYPAVSYGKVDTETIREMWKFQHGWIKDEASSQTLLYSDLFENYMMPRLSVRSGRVDDCDNFSGDLDTGVVAKAIDDCRQLCLDRTNCVQFSFANGKCALSDVPKMGEYKAGVHSRWLLARTENWARSASLGSDCPTQDFASWMT
ncbi:glycosyltransferase family 31 [Lecanosticta acicola]|uniref:Glycosyltransferase family 31 n=1 Tax=Lecanosticta acicola TaxID=111012 RepID=A0AAI9EF62_9PEZI|nr:glycosyltransferase family 31 [Lecanosticta acicola]